MTARSALFLLFGCTCFTGCSNSATTPDSGVADNSSDTVTDTATESGSNDTGADTGDACDVIDGAVVRFQTSDEVTLEADLYTTGDVASPTAILLHMIPPSNDRSNYPGVFVEALQLRGFNILNIDRRGAGGSEGVASEAYNGPQGVLDAVAAVAFMNTHACAPDPSRFVIVGASNGTTTALDYAINTSMSDTADPAALVFLTGGTYTENQNAVSSGALQTLPVLFVFSTAERAWSAAFQSDAPEPWAFLEYAEGAHGTLMFGAVDESVDAVADWMQEQVGSETEAQ